MHDDSDPSGSRTIVTFCLIRYLYSKVPMLSSKRKKLLYVPCVSSLAALSVNIKVSNIKMSMVVSLPIVLAATSAQEGARESVKQTKMPPLSSAICNALGSLLGAFFLFFCAPGVRRSAALLQERFARRSDLDCGGPSEHG